MGAGARLFSALRLGDSAPGDSLIKFDSPGRRTSCRSAPDMGRVMNRRDFLVGTSALLALQDGFASELSLAHDPRRPQFHLLPAKNWMNDPDGPIYFNGKYHMFFQYNPLAAVWGDMSWYHSSSPDMIHWTHLPIAFTPTPGSP